MDQQYTSSIIERSKREEASGQISLQSCGDSANRRRAEQVREHDVEKSPGSPQQQRQHQLHAPQNRKDCQNRRRFNSKTQRMTSASRCQLLNRGSLRGRDMSYFTREARRLGPRAPGPRRMRAISLLLQLRATGCDSKPEKSLAAAIVSRLGSELGLSPFAPSIRSCLPPCCH